MTRVTQKDSLQPPLASSVFLQLPLHHPSFTVHPKHKPTLTLTVSHTCWRTKVVTLMPPPVEAVAGLVFATRVGRRHALFTAERTPPTCALAATPAYTPPTGWRRSTSGSGCASRASALRRRSSARRTRRRSAPPATLTSTPLILWPADTTACRFSPSPAASTGLPPPTPEAPWWGLPRRPTTASWAKRLRRP